MVASTNHLDKLDAGLSSRPSRFDRKYLFPLPSEGERNIYCQYWRERLKKKKVEIEFPKRICPAVALITDGFSFAYMQEAFVATLLAIAQERSELLGDIEGVKTGGDEDAARDNAEKDLDDYELWRELKKTIKALRNDMDNTPDKDKSSTNDDSDPVSKALALEKEAQAAAGEPSSLADQSLIALRPAASRSSKGPETETAHVPGREVHVDYQGAPIITEENTFIHSLEQATA